MDQALGEGAWVIENASKDLDEIILMEENVNDMVYAKSDRNALPFFRESKRSKLLLIGIGQCILCASRDHKSMYCKKCTTLEEKRAVFREQHRCLNCALPEHFVKQCPRDGCKACNGKKHHYTLCPQRCQSTQGAQTQPPYERRTHAQAPSAASTAQKSAPKITKQAPLKRGKPAQANLLETLLAITKKQWLATRRIAKEWFSPP
ncbi:unnamed protein product [Haemonchus placei]|uniref:Nucleic-acid-binding protein from transposon X-element n=1 Tax=Haemonchus placei TaxID=6290 RepID=A0A0N4W709_HAEPC|nr:unnamed protein product [Haemonchus placei]